MEQRPTILVTLNLTDYLDEDGRVERYDLDRYVGQVGTLLEHVLARTDCAVLLMPHFYLNFQEQMLLQRVQERLQRPDRVASIDPALDAECQMHLYSRAAFAISHRYHPTIFAARAGCPFLCIRHQFKVSGMLALFDDPGPRVMTPDGPERWIDAFDEAWRSRESIMKQVSAKLPAVTAASHRHLDVLAAHLDAIVATAHAGR
jgi:polysaccharide pyruvyl transferase WcaK-like protein